MSSAPSRCTSTPAGPRRPVGELLPRVYGEFAPGSSARPHAPGGARADHPPRGREGHVDARLESAPMRIDERLADGVPTFSFEFFPPKTDAGERNLGRALAELSRLAPDFVSV